ncbi:MAG: hypothetical protein IJH04_10440 [Eggerthellaceae bacterium]|nr:hypothetical protein [Eggerthellaceae bacterium]
MTQVESFDGPIWEPACGNGAISSVLAEAGHDVISSDLVQRGFGVAGIDFLLQDTSLAPNIVTNPPFSLGVEFVRHALSLATGKVAMLLKIGFIEGPTKADLHNRLARIWVIRRRVTFLKNGETFSRSNGKGGIHTYAWFVWDRSHSGAPVVGWLEGEPCK